MANERVHLLRTDVVAAIERAGVALKARDVLLSNGMDPEQLLEHLYNICLNPPTSRDPYLRGKEDKAAKNFPERIERFAKEIEDVNTAGLFYHMVHSHLRNSGTRHKVSWVVGNHKITLNIFKTIPVHLRAYAEFVRFAIREMQKGPNDHVALVIELIDDVKRSTGRPHYQQIAKILNVMISIVKWIPPYDAAKLRDVWRNNRGRIAPPVLSPDLLD